MKKLSIVTSFGIALALVLPAVAFALEGGIDNPLPNTATFSGLLTNITRYLLGLVGTVALLALIVGGVRMILAFGKEDAVKSSKQIIFWAVVGLIVVFAAYFIISLVSRFLGVA